MIQTSFFPQPEKDAKLLGPALTKLYKIRYVIPDTGAVLEGSKYIKNGKNKSGTQEFLVNNEWVRASNVPEYRKWLKKRNSSLKKKKTQMKKEIEKKKISLVNDKNLQYM